jgi:hypothetical protein
MRAAWSAGPCRIALSLLLVTGLPWTAGPVGAAEPASSPSGFEGAKWIWHSAEAAPDASRFPQGVRYFRGALTLPDKAPVVSAELVITADNI